MKGKCVRNVAVATISLVAVAGCSGGDQQGQASASPSPAVPSVPIQSGEIQSTVLSGPQNSKSLTLGTDLSGGKYSLRVWCSSDGGAEGSIRWEVPRHASAGSGSGKFQCSPTGSTSDMQVQLKTYAALLYLSVSAPDAKDVVVSLAK